MKIDKETLKKALELSQEDAVKKAEEKLKDMPTDQFPDLDVEKIYKRGIEERAKDSRKKKIKRIQKMAAAILIFLVVGGTTAMNIDASKKAIISWMSGMGIDSSSFRFLMDEESVSKSAIDEDQTKDKKEKKEKKKNKNKVIKTSAKNSILEEDSDKEVPSWLVESYDEYRTVENVEYKEHNYDSITYKTIGKNKIRITSIKTKEDSLYIPGKFGKVTVEEIGGGSLKEGIPNLPSDIENIEGIEKQLAKYAWLSQEDQILSNLIIARGVKVIKDNCFAGISAVDILITRTCEEIGENAFANTRVDKLELHNPKIKLEKRAFYRSSLAKIDFYLGKFVGKVGSECFAYSNIEKFTWPAEDYKKGKPAEKVGAGAFKGAKKLKQVTFPKNLTRIYIMKNVFRECTALKRLEFPAGIRKLKYEATSYADNYKMAPQILILKGKNTQILGASQEGDSKKILTVGKVILPRNSKALKYIKNAYKPYKVSDKLKELTEDDSVEGGVFNFYDIGLLDYENIGDLGPEDVEFKPLEYSFSDTKKEEDVEDDKEKGIEIGEAIDVGNLTYQAIDENSLMVLKMAEEGISNLKIKNTIWINDKKYNITEIGARAFENEEQLESVEIGENITSIGDEAFLNCSNLSEIVIESENIEIFGKNSFKGINENANISSPNRKVGEYSAMIKNANEDLSNQISFKKDL